MTGYLNIGDRISPLEREPLILMAIVIRRLWHNCHTDDQIIGQEQSSSLSLADQSILVEFLINIKSVMVLNSPIYGSFIVNTQTF